MSYELSSPPPCANIDLDLATIIYTSGTTGGIKGVELTHYNLVGTVDAALQRIDIFPDDKLISVLPAWHLFERIIKYASLARGVENFYSNPKTFRKDCIEQEPCLMASVPRVWQLFYDKVMKDKNPYKRVLMNFLPKEILRKKLQEHLGTRFRAAVSAGAVDKFFAKLGIELQEAYGLTECGIVSVRTQGSCAYGTVGPLVDGVDVKITDSLGIEQNPRKEGVIHIQSPYIMKRYFKNLEDTQLVFQNGWFNTGDRGYFDSHHNLIITGREKDIIVLLNGENINPIQLEAALAERPYIGTAIVVGQDWKELGALIVPQYEMLASFCAKQGSSYPKLEHMIQDVAVQKLYKSEIHKFANENFKPFECIADFKLIAAPFEVGRELTATFKPKRVAIAEIYRKEIYEMYRYIHKK
jgi:long-chain acyl-CoA synthetase